jgi:hypothetical protein
MQAPLIYHATYLITGILILELVKLIGNCISQIQ